VSLNKICALIADSRSYSRRSARFIADASRLADSTQPEVVHPGHGKGVVVGVTAGGMLEVHFDGQPYAVAVPADSVHEVGE
jgi:hypothetical protein